MGKTNGKLNIKHKVSLNINPKAKVRQAGSPDLKANLSISPKANLAGVLNHKVKARAKVNLAGVLNHRVKARAKVKAKEGAGNPSHKVKFNTRVKHLDE